MTKRELVIEVAERLDYTQNEIAEVVQCALNVITESLAQDNRLEIRNFGVFEVKSRDARIGRNPRTGETVPITRKRVATFKPGKALKELVQSGKRAVEQASQPEGTPESPANKAPGGREAESDRPLRF
ncbi:MAG: integration host factor subunit beta [Candidatus Hydrogenedentes bacterium]|nr:integration host factor subunit beta [Candidatus Hydrogenedentota bacterium]